MQVNYKVNERTTLAVEVKDLKGSFDFLAHADSIFGVSECGNCGSHNLRFDCRTPQGYIYRSLVCADCKHTLKISEQKPENGGKLYPDREWMEPYQGGDEPRSNSGKPRRGSNRDGSDHDEEQEYAGAGNGRRRNDDGIDF